MDAFQFERTREPALPEGEKTTCSDFRGSSGIRACYFTELIYKSSYRLVNRNLRW